VCLLEGHYHPEVLGVAKGTGKDLRVEIATSGNKRGYYALSTGEYGDRALASCRCE